MRMRINDLKNWDQWSLKGPLRFMGSGPREVEVHFNCTKTTVLRVAFGDVKQEFVLVGVLDPGMTRVSMTVDGDTFFIAETEGEVWYHDPSGRNYRRANLEQVSFTGPMNRSSVDPEMQRMWRLMEARVLNQSRLREAQMQLQIDQLAAARAAEFSVDPDTGEFDGKNGGGVDIGVTGTPAEAPSGGSGGGVEAPDPAGGVSPPADPAPSPK